MFTYRSAYTGGNSTSAIVATLLVTSSSIDVDGVIATPGVDVAGGSTVKLVVNVSYGASIR